jgi:zinc/manganese transport system permease protein
VHGTAELAFTGAAAGLLVAGNPVVGALVGSLVVAALIATLGARPRERDSAIGAILAFGLGMGVLLLGYYHGFATAATNILFGNIFGVSGSQLLVLVTIGAVVVVVMGIWYRPLLFASMDPEVAEARGVPVRRLGLVFLLVLALTVTGAAQVVGTLLVLSLAITPGAAAQRLSASPLRVGVLSVVFAVVAADGGLIASFEASNVKASVFITSISFATYLLARLVGPSVREKHVHGHDNLVHRRDSDGPAPLPSPQRSAAAQAGAVNSLAEGYSKLAVPKRRAPSEFLSSWLITSTLGPRATRGRGTSVGEKAAAVWPEVPAPNRPRG